MGDTTEHDIKQLCLNSDITIEDDLVKHFFHKYGNFRPVKVLLNALEEYCESNDLQSASLNTFKISGVERINAKYVVTENRVRRYIRMKKILCGK